MALPTAVAAAAAAGKPAPSGPLGPGGSGHAVTIDDAILCRMAEEITDLPALATEAAAATEFEHGMTLLQALQLYPKAAAFSMIVSLALVMEGYDTSLLGSFFGYPAFQRRFGEPVGDGTYQLSAAWQSGLQNGVQVGEIIGLWVAGSLAERLGYRRAMLGALALMVGVIFVMFFAQNIAMLMVGEVLCGLPWGAFQTLTTTYAAEISPLVLRPYLTTWVNMCWVIGQLISAGLLRGLLNRTDEWGWRIPYATQWFWPVPIIVAVLLAPESPWWLVRQDRLEDAKRELQSLVSGRARDAGFDADRYVAMMVYTNALEKSASAGMSYRDCFAGTDRRRTEIACAVWVIQVTCGIWFGGNVIYFLEQAGFDTQAAFSFGLGHNAVALAGTLCAWWAMRHIGRRSLYLAGLAVMLAILVVIGFLGIPAPTPAIGYASGTLLMVFTFTYDVTVGPVCYSLVAEMPSTRLRIKTVALARNCYNVVSILANFLNNPILNPTAWNLRGKGGFVWCGFCLLSLVWAYYRLPEPRGLGPAELDVLFERKVRARDFGKVRVDQFRAVASKAAAAAEVEEEEENAYGAEK